MSSSEGRFDTRGGLVLSPGLAFLSLSYWRGNARAMTERGSQPLSALLARPRRL